MARGGALQQKMQTVADCTGLVDINAQFYSQAVPLCRMLSENTPMSAYNLTIQIGHFSYQKVPRACRS